MSLFPISQLTKGIAVISAGTAIAQAIGLAAVPILTRLYNPADFGVLGVYASALAVLAAIAALRFELAVPLPENTNDAVSLVILSMIISTGFCALAATGLWLTHEQLSSVDHLGTLSAYVPLLVAGVFAASLYQTLSYWAVRVQAYPVIARTRLSEVLGMITVQIGTGLLGLGPIGLLVGHIIGQAGGFVILARLIIHPYQERSSRLTISTTRTLAIRYRRFPLYTAPATLLNAVGNNIPPILLAATHGAEIAGYFFVAQRILGAPLTLLGRSVSQAYNGEAAKLLRGQDPHLARLFFSLAKKLVVVAIPMAILVMLFASSLFAWALGAEWREAGHYAEILVLMFIPRFVTSPLSITMSILERQQVTLLIQTIVAASSIGSLALGIWMDLAAESLIAFFSITMSAAYAIEFGILATQVRNWSQQLDA